MCVHRLLSSYGAGGCVLLAEKRLRQSFWIAAAFLFANFGAVPPLLSQSRRRQIAHWPLPKIFRKPVFESPPASGNKLDFFALTGRYHPARHENNNIFHGGR